MDEKWEDIAGYNGLYQVSNLGRVKNKKGLIMAQKPSKDGYVRLLLFKDGKYKAEYVHILVAKAFIPNPAHKPEVNHIDADKANNKVDNLEWVTSSENHSHAVALGLIPICPTIGKYGADNPGSKPVAQYDLAGNLIKVWPSREEAGQALGCRRSDICNAINGWKKSCKGFMWRDASKMPASKKIAKYIIKSQLKEVDHERHTPSPL